MAEIVRVAALTRYVETMAAFGVDPRPLLREQGLSPDQFSNPEAFLPARAVIRLLERSAQATGRMAFGLHMAEGRTIANLGAASLLIAHQQTLRQALAALSEYRVRINSTLILHLEEIGDTVVLREDFALRRPEPSRQASDLAVGVLAQLCRTVMGSAWRPQGVCFAHESLPPGERPIIGRVFGCPAQFDAEFNGLVLARSDLDRANPSADGELADHARRLLESVPGTATPKVADEVDQLIRLLLPTGRATIVTCASSLGVTTRTLQRTLDSEGTSFSRLLNEARLQLAVQYLSNPRMRITDIADMLGYASIGAFTRWHTHSFGLSPRHWRGREMSAS